MAMKKNEPALTEKTFKLPSPIAIFSYYDTYIGELPTGIVPASNHFFIK